MYLRNTKCNLKRVVFIVEKHLFTDAMQYRWKEQIEASVEDLPVATVPLLGRHCVCAFCATQDDN
jgi:hypothetical protein